MGPASRASRRVLLSVNLALAVALAAQPLLAAGPPDKADPGLQNALDSLNGRARAYGLANHAPPSDPTGITPAVLEGFELVGHNALGARDTNADVWVHEGFAYVGTWAFPCTGRGVKIIDVSDPSAPRVVASAASRRGTSAEDMVVRKVATPSFTGDLMAVGIQRCGPQGGPSAVYGAEFWDVTDPRNPRRLGEFATTVGGGGVHELDLIVREDGVYAALASPFNEWFDPSRQGDVFIVDVTNPRSPQLVADWGVVADSTPPRGPFDGQGSFGAVFAHSVRFSEDGRLLYASYWDRGVITLDVSEENIASPTEINTATAYPADADGDMHSMVPFGDYLLTNDEDFDPRSPAHIAYGTEGAFGVASESPAAPALWDVGSMTAPVFEADNEGCNPADYAGITADVDIAVVQTPFDFFGSVEECSQGQQEAAAEAAGAVAVVHRFDSLNTSPQWWSIGPVGIPVLFTDTATADAIVEQGSATLEPQLPSWGFLRVYDAGTGEQVSQFDAVPNINDLEAAETGFWSIHNTEVWGDTDTVYSSWYSNGIVGLDLSEITDIEMIAQFVPPGDFPSVWGVFIDEENDLIYASDESTGLWIIRPSPND